MNEKVSVIIPVYNVEKYLKQCIESVLNQTYKNLEIILVDDGTKDNSGIICDDYSKKDTRIKVIHQKNMGLSGARNVGLENSTGNFITFIDSDDFINSEMIDLMMSVLKNDDIDIVECGTIFCNEKGKYIKEKVSTETKIFEKENQLKELLIEENINTTSWGKIYRKKLFKEIKFPLGKYHEDVFTTYKLLHFSRRTAVLNKSFYYYRQVNGSIMNSNFSLKHLDSIEANLERSKFIEKYYPQYKKYTYANTVYSCCKVYERMILSNFNDKDIIKRLQILIRKYLINFLFYSKSRKKTKLFAIICCLSMNLSRIIYKKLKG